MKETKDVLTEISSTLREIEGKYPELQKYLDETRNTLPSGQEGNTELNKDDLQTYLDNLKEMVENYKKEH
jgi:hypothetical protein